MLKVNKYTNINLSIAWISFDILKLLKEDKLQKYNDIYNKIIYKKGASAKENFLLALSFLFILGKIKYYQWDDVIELLTQ